MCRVPEGDERADSEMRMVEMRGVGVRRMRMVEMRGVGVWRMRVVQVGRR